MKDHFDCKWVSFLFRKKRWAITLFGHTFYSVPAITIGEHWKAHEDWHKRQQAEGAVPFYFKYLFFHFIKGHTGNPYEAEARLAETMLGSKRI